MLLPTNFKHTKETNCRLLRLMKILRGWGTQKTWADPWRQNKPTAAYANKHDCQPMGSEYTTKSHLCEHGLKWRSRAATVLPMSSGASWLRSMHTCHKNKDSFLPHKSIMREHIFWSSIIGPVVCEQKFLLPRTTKTTLVITMKTWPLTPAIEMICNSIKSLCWVCSYKGCLYVFNYIFISSSETCPYNEKDFTFARYFFVFAWKIAFERRLK